MCAEAAPYIFGRVGCSLGSEHIEVCMVELSSFCCSRGLAISYAVVRQHGFYQDALFIVCAVNSRLSF